MSTHLTNEELVAYALGEGDPTLQKAVEERIASDPEARKLVEETRAIAALAGEAFSEGTPAMTEAQREEVVRAAQPGESKGRVVRFRPLLLAAAAVILLVGGVYLSISVSPYLTRSRMTAGRSQEELQRFKELGMLADEGAVDNRKMNSHSQLAETDGQAHYQDAPAAEPLPQPELEALGYAGGQVNALVPPPVDAPIESTNGIAFFAEDSHTDYLTAESNAPPQSYAYDVDGDGVGSAIPMHGGPNQAGEWSYRKIPPEERFVDDPNLNYWPGHNTEDYNAIVENPFRRVTDHPLSTFSIDVDTASYANMRRFINQGTLPPPDAVRIEEMINYFHYDYAPPKDKEDPFAAHIDVAACPWTPAHQLVRIGLKGWEMARDERPVSNLVFLIDVSGSMQPENKLPLLKDGMRMLVDQLGENDRVAMVVYAGASGLVLPATTGDNKEVIVKALDDLQSGGSTNGGQGIELAYRVAAENYIKGGVNRVILATDGDFNVGTTDQGSLVHMVGEKAKSGVFLTVLGFGMGNLNDAMLEQIADKGNGNYAYIDNKNEARKVLVEQMSGTLVTIAKDVKIQVEFNPAHAAAYRLIGYENRMLKKEDFNDDTKDAGEIGAGHTVTALYEVVPVGQEINIPGVDPLKYQQPAVEKTAQLESKLPYGDELLTVKLRYKQPDGDTSKLLEFPVKDEGRAFSDAPQDMRFAAAVAEFGMLLRGSEYKGSLDYPEVLDIAAGAMGEDAYGYRKEFVELVDAARGLKHVE